MTTTTTLPSVCVYVIAVVAANLNVAFFGPAVTPINAFFLIGLDLALRDSLHRAWEGQGLVYRMGALIAGAGLLSYALNPAAGQIAVASVAAFVASNTVDAMIFQHLRGRGYMLRSNVSNLGGAAVDSFVFPLVAFGALMPGVVAMQFVAKVSGGALWTAVFNRLRAAK